MKALLQQAVDALDAALSDDHPYINKCIDAAESLRAAIEQPESEPVEFQFQDTNGKWCPFLDQRHYDNTAADGRWPIRALYTAPVGYVPLSDAEIIDIRKQCYGGRFGVSGAKPWSDSVKFARAVIERAVRGNK